MTVSTGFVNRFGVDELRYLGCDRFMTDSSQPGLEFVNHHLDRRSQRHMAHFTTMHLLLEQSLNMLLRESFENEEFVDKLGSFMAKLNTARGLDLVDEDVFIAMKKINDSRNKVSHSIDYVVDADYIDSLVSSFPKKVRDTIRAVVESDNSGDRLAEEMEKLVSAGHGPLYVDAYREGWQRSNQDSVTINHMFLHLYVAIGWKVAKIRYDKKYGELIKTYYFIETFRRTEPDNRTNEQIWEHLAIPDPPHPNKALEVLFGDESV